MSVPVATSTTTQTVDDVLAPIAAQIDVLLHDVLAGERERWAAIDPWLAEPVSMLADFVLAGGKRLRPAFCTYGHLGAGGHPDDPGLLAAAAGLELLHA